MKKRVTKTDEVIEKILEGLEGGKTLTSVCTGEDMPTIQALNKWCRADTELDDQIFRAWVRGLRIRHDYNSDKQEAILKNPDKYDPKTINALATIMRDVNHTLMATLTRLDKRYSDKSQVENIGPLSISWDDAPKVEEKKPDALSALTNTTPAGGEVRKH
jgi:hypothetical protein